MTAIKMDDVQTNVLRFGNGHTMPALGFGTWQSTPDEAEEAVTDAIRAGYRHIDTAYLYGNEVSVGNAIHQCIRDGLVTRDQLFVTTKLCPSYHRPDLVKVCFLKSLERLQLDYLDLYLIHIPTAWQEGGEDRPQDEAGNTITSDADYLDAWKELEKLVDEGLTRSIGVSNLNSHQLQRTLGSNPRHPISNLQIEISPYFPNTKLIEWAQAKGIVVTAHSPFGSPGRPWATSADRVLFDEPKLITIATAHGKTPAQVAIRWALQRGCSVIPKSVTKDRIVQNSQVFDFELSADEVTTLNTAFEPARVCDHPIFLTGKYYPYDVDF